VNRYEGTPGHFRISNSELQEYLMCNLRRWYRLEDKARRTTVKMAIGTGVAKGAKADNLEKLAYRHLPLTQLVDAAVAGYDEEVQTSEVAEARSEIAGGHDETADAARTFGLQVSPMILPILAEKPIVVELGEIELAGTPDYICAEGCGDLKCGRLWTGEHVARSTQLTAYSILHRAVLGDYPKRVWIDSVHRVRGSWAAARIWGSRGSEDRTAFYQLLLRVKQSIEAGIALPAPEMAWWCAPAYCAFYRKCWFKTGRRQS
jgi:CRISPR/Cas system-associated exonuclease Cas4 (RecB family)